MNFYRVLGSAANETRLGVVNRRRFLLSSAGVSAAVLGGPWAGAATAASEDDLAFANFGVSAEFLLKDFYSKALVGKKFRGPRANVLRQGRMAATKHARTLSNLLVSFGDTPPLDQDFEFAWPRRTFSSAPATVKTGLIVLRALLGTYQSAAATASVVDYRILYASLGASIGEQIGALSALAAPVGAKSFPVATDVETASAAIETYLG
jgi:hypothetical protein